MMFSKQSVRDSSTFFVISFRHFPYKQFVANSYSHKLRDAFLNHLVSLKLLKNRVLHHIAVVVNLLLICSSSVA